MLLITHMRLIELWIVVLYIVMVVLCTLAFAPDLCMHGPWFFTGRKMLRILLHQWWGRLHLVLTSIPGLPSTVENLTVAWSGMTRPHVIITFTTTLIRGWQVNFNMWCSDAGDAGGQISPITGVHKELDSHCCPYLTQIKVLTVVFISVTVMFCN